MSKKGEALPFVLVTGANGWLGRSSVQVLTERYPEKFQILALTRKGDASNIWSDQTVRSISYNDLETFNFPIHGIVHTAFKTQSYVNEMDIRQYKNENLETIEWLKNFIHIHHPTWAVGISSGAATKYLDKISTGETLNLEDVYGELKVFEEKVLLSSSVEHVAVGRLWGGSGRFMQNYKIYALGQFIENALNGSDIAVNSANEVFRRYVDVEDFIDVLLNCAWENARTLIDSGGQLTSIQDLAEEVAKTFRTFNKSEVKVKYLNKVENGDTQNYYPHSNRFELLMERYGIISHSLTEQIERTSSAVADRLDKNG